VVILGAAAWGYFWWSGLTNASARLDADIQTAEARRAELQAVIDQDAVYEELKAELERRIAAIDLLRRNRVSPVVSLDMLSEAVEDTRYVWISALNQTNTTFSINATGTSIQAIETFLINLDNTGYFTNVNLGPLQESGPNYTFQLAMTFVPPLLPGESAAAATSADARLAGAGGPEPGGGR
jgi:Tfp pilus assembly protein PilN